MTSNDAYRQKGETIILREEKKIFRVHPEAWGYVGFTTELGRVGRPGLSNHPSKFTVSMLTSRSVIVSSLNSLNTESS
jgi:hypothetical protein